MEGSASKILHSSAMDDRISTLPKELRCHILSFLPTKEAVATSVLSTKWRPLWRSVPTLDFDNFRYTGPLVDYACFVESVYAFILTRDQHQPLHKFRLRLWASITERPKDPANVTVWVNFTVQSQVQHLDICLCNHRKLPLPPPTISPVLSSCTNLVVLKLYGLSLNPLSTVDFPLLKTLHLQDLYFLGYECLAKLLSRCPLLQDFKAMSLFSIYHLPDGSNYKTLPVQFLHINQIKLISNAVLRIDEITNHSAFTVLSNLTQIELSYTTFNKDWLNIVEVLKYCPHLQVLVINQEHGLSYEIAEFEFQVRDWPCPQPVPKCILQHLKRCYLNDYRGSEDEFQFATYVMQHGRVLESMTICSDHYVEEGGKHENLKQLSSCTRRSATCKLFFE